MNDIVRQHEDPAAGTSKIPELTAVIAKAPGLASAAVPVAPAPVPPAPVPAPAPAGGPAVAVPAAAAPARAVDPEVERGKRLAAARERRESSKTKPFLFVLWTLGAWWGLLVLADIVITCVPGGTACRVPYLYERVFGRLSIFTSNNPPPDPGGAALSALTKYEWPLLLLALLAALWVAKGKVYPETDDTGEFTEAELNGKA